MERIEWAVDERGRPTAASVGGEPLFVGRGEVLVGGVNPVAVRVEEDLTVPPGDADVACLTLTLDNPGPVGVTATVAVSTAVMPSPLFNRTVAEFPIAVYATTHHPALSFLGPVADPDPRAEVGVLGAFEAFYLEPAASDPSTRTTTRPLLVPLVQWSQRDLEPRLTLFGDVELPWRIAYQGRITDPLPAWTMRTRLALVPGERREVRVWLHVSDDDGRAGWAAFHRHAAPPAGPAAAWPSEAKVHYYDFLSAETPGGPRGRGFDRDAERFADFHVGMATQHAYYPGIGDYLRPGRDKWLAMRGDNSVPFEMSLDLMRDRIRRTRAAGSRATIYIHQALFDSASDLYPDLRDAVMVGPDGLRIAFPWNGPETVGQNFHMSIAAEAWREHLLGQVRHIMELLDPDGIVVDETFAGLGYDHHPDRAGPLSRHMIPFTKRLRALIRSYGDDKALFTSDCGYASFVLWCDGEAGDHAYEFLLGQPQYRRASGGFASVLGTRRWLPGAWHWTYFWDRQMELSRSTGAGVGVSNGWLEYAGLNALPTAIERRVLADLDTLHPRSSAKPHPKT